MTQVSRGCIGAAIALAMSQPAFAEPSGSAQTNPSLGGDFFSRPKLSGDWGGVRDEWAAHGVTLDLDTTYTFQGIPDGGGAEGSLFERFSDEGDTGNTFSGDLVLQLDTGKAGLWPGGFFKARIEGRTGESVVRRAGTVSPVNKDGLFPNVSDRFDEEVFGLTELTATQFLSEKFGVVGGLLNILDADANEIAGNARSDAHFLNLAFLMSLVETATAPNVTLGGGLVFLPTKDITGTLTAFNTEESAGENPFEHDGGTTLATEWSMKHTLGGHPGGQRLGFLYGFDKDRADIAQDPRVIVASVLQGLPIPSTDSDTWALYYNAHQYVQGDSKGGWGPFLRFGLSDGDPNPVESNVAVGLGGKGLLPGRDADNWGAGFYYLGMSDEDLLERLGVDDELGGEVYYNIAVAPSIHITLDAQVIDSALARNDTTWALGVRTHVDF